MTSNGAIASDKFTRTLINIGARGGRTAEGGPGPRPPLAQSHHHRSADIAPPCSVRRHPSLMRPTDGTMTQWVYPSNRGFSSISLLSSPAGIGRCGRPLSPISAPRVVTAGRTYPEVVMRMLLKAVYDTEATNDLFRGGEVWDAA